VLPAPVDILELEASLGGWKGPKNRKNLAAGNTKPQKKVLLFWRQLRP
jgi:hypothetical protein